MNIDAAIFFYFMLYAWGGWLLENIYSRITTGVFWKEGFLFSPLKPMYGLTMVILLLLYGAGLHWSIFMALCFVVPTFVEAVSGWLLHRVFDRRYWDYSGARYQWQGYICFSFSLCWLLLSVATIFILHPWIERGYGFLATAWQTIAPILAVGLISDLLCSTLTRLPWLGIFSRISRK